MKRNFKKFVYAFLGVCVTVSVIIVAPIAGARSGEGTTQIDPAPLAEINPIRDEKAPAMFALASIYAPQENADDWIASTCKGMTEGGCNYFKANQAKGIRESLAGSIGSSSGFGEIIQKFDDNTQLWKTTVTVFSPDHKEKTSDVYAVMRRGQDGRWLVDRILIGPGVVLQ